MFHANLLGLLGLDDGWGMHKRLGCGRTILDTSISPGARTGGGGGAGRGTAVPSGSLSYILDLLDRKVGVGGHSHLLGLHVDDDQ